MAQVAMGQFAEPASTGNQAIAGVGFTPDLVIFWGHSNSSLDANTAHSFTMLGAMTTTDQWCVYGTLLDAKASEEAKTYLTTSFCLAGSPANNARASYVSMDADGFTVNWAARSSTGRVVHYLALEGYDAAVGAYLGDGTTNDQVVSGLGFQPTGLILASQPSGTLNTTAESTTKNNNLWFGVASGTGAGEEGCCALFADDAADPTDNVRFHDTSAVLKVLGSGGAEAYRATLKGFDSDGFTLEPTVAFGSYLFYIAFGGAVCLADGDYQHATSTGNQTITTSGVDPVIAFLVSLGTGTKDSNVDDYRITIGFGIDGANGRSIWGGGDDNVGTTVCDRHAQTDEIMMTGDTNGIVNSEASLSSLGSEEFVLNWSSVVAGGENGMWMVIGDAPSGVGNSLGGLDYVGGALGAGW